MRVVTAKELKNRTGEVLRHVREGEVVTITIRGVRVAKVIPLDRDARARSQREQRKSRMVKVREVAGKYRGMGTVEEFLEEKRRETALER